MRASPSWDQLISAFGAEGWSVAVDHLGVTVETARGDDGLLDFSKDPTGLQHARQFWDDYRTGQHVIRQPSLDSLRASLQQAYAEEQAAGPVNTLAAWRESQRRRTHITRERKRFTHAVQQLETLLDELPPLPATQQIQWAQTVLALPNLAFWEIDTTGLRQDDDIVRFTLVDQDGSIIEDCFITPATGAISEHGQTKPVRYELNAGARHASGIASAQLAEGLSLAHAWERIQAALTGRYVLSFNQEWDVQKLASTAERYGLPPVLVIGDCLQRHATQYYHREYALSLEELCARAGVPLPEKPNQTSIDRARGQRAVLHAFADAVTDVRIPSSGTEPAPQKPRPAQASTTGDDCDPFLDEDVLP